LQDQCRASRLRHANLHGVLLLCSKLYAAVQRKQA
jgi:hypothetical protein